MSYTPPGYAEADISWAGESPYTPPSFDAADVTWQASSSSIGYVVSIGNIDISGKTASLNTGWTGIAQESSIVVIGLLPTKFYSFWTGLNGSRTY